MASVFIKKSFISNPAWGCEWGIEQAQKGTHPSPRESPTPPRSLQRPGQVRGRPSPFLPRLLHGQLRPLPASSRGREAWDPRPKAAFFTSAVVTPALLPLDVPRAPPLGSQGGRAGRRGGAARPGPPAASSVPPVTQQGSQGDVTVREGAAETPRPSGKENLPLLFIAF